MSGCLFKVGIRFFLATNNRILCPTMELILENYEDDYVDKICN